jgi:F420-non-reducing hydrogenase iron-sulfur subunit
MCSGRVDMEFIFRAFENGQDGVLIGGCKLNECNYITHGNFDALSTTYICKNIMGRIGLNTERLGIEFMSGGDGNRLAEVVNTFVEKIADMGPLGETEGIELARLGGDLAAVQAMIPYLRLVEREKLRPPVKTEEAYHEFFAGKSVQRLFYQLIGDKLALSRIVTLLREKPLSAGDISGRLGLAPSEVARHMNNSSRQGMVTYDTANNCYTLTGNGPRV